MIVQLPDDGKPFNTTLPVGSEQLGWVIAPAVGAVGVVGCALIITLVVAAEVHPEALVTLKLYVPVERTGTFVLVPEPVILNGLMVQLPDDGKPFNTTLPVGTKQVGWVMAPTVGAAGVVGCALMIILVVLADVHPDALVTLKLYMPVERTGTLVLVPEPVMLTGLIVQLPDDGKPFNTTLPVDTKQVGWVMVPTVGVVGRPLTVKE